ncbi:MAG TPA: CHC2 zinc finger domain-containing protein [Polyangiaceae bacterium]|nr:CHC2 zinc finger domain-containing protein [Polyangiaceae bacterium]
MNDLAREIRQALSDPRALCHALELDKGAKRQTAGLTILCPVHAERTPSCSVTRGDGGTVRVRCFGCDFTGDALTLIAVVRGIDVRSRFREVLAEGARLGGLHHVLAELESGSSPPADRPVVAPTRQQEAPREPERTYPPREELAALWAASGPVANDPGASGALVSRRIDPLDVDAQGLLRCFAQGIAHDRLPRWAAYQGQTWRDTGHRMLAKVFDQDGVWRSVRAWRVGDGSSPKRLPPAGHKAAGLVLANYLGARLLRGEPAPKRIVIVEGEPDHLVRSIASPDLPVIGVLSGSWHPGYAERIPWGAEVVIRTHNDQAGDRYAEQIITTIRQRARVWRSQPEEK